MAGAQNLAVVLSRIRLAAVARGSRVVTSESDEVLAKHKLFRRSCWYQAR
jgi:hypothetical protein